MHDKNTNESDIDKLLKEFFKLDGTMWADKANQFTNKLNKEDK